jgi:hypothetical protein
MLLLSSLSLDALNSKKKKKPSSDLRNYQSGGAREMRESGA